MNTTIQWGYQSGNGTNVAETATKRRARDRERERGLDGWIERDREKFVDNER